MPLAWHVRSRNVGTIALSVWLLLGNLDTIINSFAWWSSTADKAPGFCEISVRLRHVMFIAIPASNLVIAKKLEAIASTRQIRVAAADRRRAVVVDLMICVGIPFVFGALMVVNQARSYSIIQEIGCWPVLTTSWVWVLLVALPVILVCLVSAIYSAVDMLIFFPVYIGSIAKQIKDAITVGYGSWQFQHQNFGEVLQVPADLVKLQSSGQRGLILSRLVCPISGLIFFAMFGFGQEVRQGYKQAFGRVLSFCKLRKVTNLPPPGPIVADIEVVTFRSRETCGAPSPHSEKFSFNKHALEDA
ncbi:Fungal pheromone mating factor [Kalmanozyma brasiliensis GHG001]|uniref:G-protein coupled receptor-Pheromone receptor protein n=2 Tax=Kalmanozyma brasiliensis TaxID=1392244 RepID=V5E6L0_KALBG|nr:Fungal pheromone mating factor [Kalmanozyma brasiliensis GHG001]EST05906.1 Fungal pheromone mating factor [Kalmanozyma brasiliensis GHG001]